MKIEKQTALLTYMSVIATAFSAFIFIFFFSGQFSRQLMVSILGVFMGILASMTGIYFYTFTKRRSIRVFISYAYSDSERVKQIRDYLEIKGFVVSEPETTVRIGDDISKAVNNALQSSDCIVLVLSQQSASSEWVKKEIEKAKEMGKRLYPVRIDDVSPPADIATIRFADLRNKDDNEMRKLVIAIRENHGR
jgi:hypothetical protein